MALLWMDGFDSYAAAADLAQNYTSNTTAGFSTTGGRFGGGSPTVTNSALQRSIAASTELWTGFAHKATGIGSNTGFTQTVRFLSSLTQGECDVSIQADGSIWVTDSNGVLKGKSATGIIVLNTWNWIEVHYLLGATAGTAEVWVNGVQVINLTGIRTTTTSATSIVAINYMSGGSASNFNFDDIYINDTTLTAPLNGRLGDCRIDTLVPASDAVPNNGTPSSGTAHYAMVNELRYDTTSTLTLTNTTGQEERFGITALPTTPNTIFAVSALAWTEKSDTGAASAKVEIVSGATVALGAAYALTTGYGQTKATYVTDPATSAAWTATAVGALKVGYVVQ